MPHFHTAVDAVGAFIVAPATEVDDDDDGAAARASKHWLEWQPSRASPFLLAPLALVPEN